MTEKFILTEKVSYRDVDRAEVLLLPGVFRFLQEAAILHANQFNTGTHAMQFRGETWVLNRMAVAIHRYARFEEMLRIETWSSGIKTFKGYRDFRVFDARDQLVIEGSSLWLYLNVKSKSIVRVPQDVAAGFPSHAGTVFCPELETLDLAAPDATAASEHAITLRYADVDVNEHVNNTAYLDLVQTALARAGLSPHPTNLRIKYAKAIPAGTDTVNVRIEVRRNQPAEGEKCHPLDDTTANARRSGARFSIEREGVVFAIGEVAESKQVQG